MRGNAQKNKKEKNNGTSKHTKLANSHHLSNLNQNHVRQDLKMYRIIKIILIIISIAISVNLYAITKPPYPPATGSQILDSINRFIHDTLWWEQGDPIPDTGNATLNKIAQKILNIANGGCKTPSADGTYYYCGKNDGVLDPRTGESPHGQFGGGGASGSWELACPSGTKLDPNTNNCVSLPKCPGGYQLNTITNVCEPVSGGRVDCSPTYTVQGTTYNFHERTGGGFLTDSEGKKYQYFVCNYITPNRFTASYTIKLYAQQPKCPTDYILTDGNKCIVDISKIKCPSGHLLNKATNKCEVNPQTCLPPMTIINGQCVVPKTQPKTPSDCPVGQKYNDVTEKCETDPRDPANQQKTCDPVIQQCNPDGTPKCDCCAKLDTIIGNMGKQIELHNKTNSSLAQIIANQKTQNLKLDAITQLINRLQQSNNANAQILKNQLGEVIKLLKDGIKLDIEPIIKKIDEIIANDNKNHGDLTDLIARGLIDTEQEKPYLKIISEQLKQQPTQIASAVSPMIDEITENQDEQTYLLRQIRDLFKDGKENPEPPPDPRQPDEISNGDFDPFGAIKGYNISQNRINANAQCPADKEFVVMGQTFKLSLSYLCQFFAMLAPVFLSIAYFTGAKIVIKGLD